MHTKLSVFSMIYRRHFINNIIMSSNHIEHYGGVEIKAENNKRSLFDSRSTCRKRRREVRYSLGLGLGLGLFTKDLWFISFNKFYLLRLLQFVST